MRMVATLLAFLLLPAIANAGMSRHVTLFDAETICSERSLRFADSIRGRDADLPDDMLVRDHYRSCVHAKSGAYPSQKLALDNRGLFNLNALFSK